MQPLVSRADHLATLPASATLEISPAALCDEMRRVDSVACTTLGIEVAEAKVAPLAEMIEKPPLRHILKRVSEAVPKCMPKHVPKCVPKHVPKHVSKHVHWAADVVDNAARCSRRSKGCEREALAPSPRSLYIKAAIARSKYFAANWVVANHFPIEEGYLAGDEKATRERDRPSELSLPLTLSHSKARESRVEPNDRSLPPSHDVAVSSLEHC